MILKLSNIPMPKRESSPESSPEPSESFPPTSITGFKTAIEYIKVKRRQPLEKLAPWERESLFLTEKVFNKNFIIFSLFLSDLSPQALGYELELGRLRAKIDKMRPELKRLEVLEDRELELRALGLRSKVNQVDSLQENVRLLNETCRKLKNETIVLKENVAVLGEMANLMWLMTMTMVRYSHQDMKIDDDVEIELLTENLETLGDVADLMSDMSQLMARDSALE
jgi:hypothetical protein